MAQEEFPRGRTGRVEASTSSHSVAKSAGAMGAATFLSRITGLVREQVFAIFFGAGHFTDAFYIAFRIPNLLRDLFAEGALSSAFITTFHRVRVRDGERRAWRVAGLVFRALFIIGSVIALVGIFFSESLVRMYAPSFTEIPEKFKLTTLMTQVLFPFFPLVSLAAAFMGILNACGKFFLPAFASALFNITSVATGLLFAWILPKFGVEAIVGMAVGVVLGGAVQAFSQLPSLYRSGYRYETRETLPDAPPWHQEKALGEILALMLPSIVGLAATQVNVLINSVLATGLGAGAVTWISYAFRLMQFPIGIFGVSLASATLPEVSRRLAAGEVAPARETLTKSIRFALAVNLPASVGLAVTSVPVVSLLFQYGKFHADDTHATARVVAGYAAGLSFYSLVKILVPVCYAARKTKQAVLSSLFTILISYFAGVNLIGHFGPMGLAFATSIAAFVNSTYLFLLLREYIDLRSCARAFFEQVLVAGFMGAVVYGADRVLTHFMGDAITSGTAVRLVLVGSEVLIGVAAIGVVGKGLGIRDTSQAFDWAAGKARRVFSRVFRR